MSVDLALEPSKFSVVVHDLDTPIRIQFVQGIDVRYVELTARQIVEEVYGFKGISSAQNTNAVTVTQIKPPLQQRRGY